MTAHPFEHPANTSADRCPFMPVFGPPALMIERGLGTEVWDSNGKRYLDFLAGIAVVSLGHSNPVVADAIGEQAHTLVHVSNFFANPVATDAALKVTALLEDATGHAGQVFFTNSGAESNECAIKLARKHGGRGRHTVVSVFGSFHGRTLASLAATGQPGKHEPFAPMPEGFKHVAWGDLDAMEAAVDGTVAAVLIEAIQGEGGINPASAAYLRGLRELCDRTGALLIIDEIQTGFARTGEWFAFEHSGVSPDVVTLAKAMGNGMPVGACWARRDVAAVFEPGDHGSTYSGTALAAAAVNATIDEMRRIDAPAVARRQGARLVEALSAIDGVVGVRGKGLMLGVALAEGLDAKQIYADLLGAGLIVNAVNGSTIRLVPPITVTDAEVDEAVEMIATAIAGAAGGDVTTHLLDIADFSAADIEAMMRLAEAPIDALGHPLTGLGAALIFEKPSARTRHSMEMAVVQLGGHPVFTRGEEVGFDTREPVEDVAKIMEGFHALVAARVYDHTTLTRMAEVSAAPIVNMLSDHSHPLQALADALTMRQRLGDLAGRTVAYVGDYNNVARSLAEVAARHAMHLRLACPVGFEADVGEIERLLLLGAASVEQGNRPIEVVAGAHAVHTDTWISMGQEQDTATRRQKFEGFTVNEEMMSQADPDAIFMHCLPAYRGFEVTADVIDGPQSVVFQQGHNRMHAARGALAFVLGVRP